jgi:hypothetical protein
MDTRFKLTEIKTFLKIIRLNIYHQNDVVVSKQDKINCCKKVVINLLEYVWNGVTAPFVYPIWYLFKNQITKKVYNGTSWEEISSLMSTNKISEVKNKLLVNGKFMYWLWTYSDSDDPLGKGGLPDVYKNTFFGRFYWGAIRNPRFNFNYMEFRTQEITQVVTIIDKRNFNFMHKSFGLGDSPDGVYFKWMKDKNNNWYFIYEDNNEKNLFYIGYTGLLKQDIGQTGGRFETGYRNTDSSYCVKV